MGIYQELILLFVTSGKLEITRKTILSDVTKAIALEFLTLCVRKLGDR